MRFERALSALREMEPDADPESEKDSDPDPEAIPGAMCWGFNREDSIFKCVFTVATWK